MSGIMMFKDNIYDTDKKLKTVSVMYKNIKTKRICFICFNLANLEFEILVIKFLILYLMEFTN